MLKHWSYRSLVLSHANDLFCRDMSHSHICYFLKHKVLALCVYEIWSKFIKICSWDSIDDKSTSVKLMGWCHRVFTWSNVDKVPRCQLECSRSPCYFSRSDQYSALLMKKWVSVFNTIFDEDNYTPITVTTEREYRQVTDVYPFRDTKREEVRHRERCSDAYFHWVLTPLLLQNVAVISNY